MPQINTKLINTHEPIEDGEYQILNVDNFTSPKGDKGLKVTMASLDKSDKKDYSTILWVRPDTGLRSKLGAFIKALSEIDEETGQPTITNTDHWLGQKISFVIWEDKKREIRVLPDDE